MRSPPPSSKGSTESREIGKRACSRTKKWRCVHQLAALMPPFFSLPYSSPPPPSHTHTHTHTHTRIHKKREEEREREREREGEREREREVHCCLTNKTCMVWKQNEQKRVQEEYGDIAMIRYAFLLLLSNPLLIPTQSVSFLPVPSFTRLYAQNRLCSRNRNPTLQHSPIHFSQKLSTGLELQNPNQVHTACACCWCAAASPSGPSRAGSNEQGAANKHNNSTSTSSV